MSRVNLSVCVRVREHTRACSVRAAISQHKQRAQKKLVRERELRLRTPPNVVSKGCVGVQVRTAPPPLGGLGPAPRSRFPRARGQSRNMFRGTGPVFSTGDLLSGTITCVCMLSSFVTQGEVSSRHEARRFCVCSLLNKPTVFLPVLVFSL